MRNASALLFIALWLCPSAHASPAEPSRPDERSGVRWGVMPIGNYTTDEGFTFGAYARRFDYGTPGELPFQNLLTFQATYAPKGTRGGFVELEKTRGILGWRTRGYVYGFASDRERYHGVGDSTALDEADAEAGAYSYSLYRAGGTLELRKDLGGEPVTGWSARAGLSPFFLFEKPSEEAEDGGLYARDFGDGIRRTFTTRVFTGLILEKRDNEFSATDGEAASILISLGPGMLASGTSTWAALDSDWRIYRPLFGPLTLALQLRQSSATASTPLALKPRLGGFGTQRGLVQNRYLANHTASLRTELRSFVLRLSPFGLPFRGGGGVFGELGRAGDSFGRLFGTPTRPSWGLTFFGSFFTDDFIGRADIGFSPEGYSTYIGIGHAI